MEEPPQIPQGPREELSFEDQLLLANSLRQAVRDRNQFETKMVGLDTFAEAGWDDDTRAEYDRLSKAAEDARKVFDEGVHDKATFVKACRERGNTEIGDMIERAFRLKPRRGFFGRFR